MAGQLRVPTVSGTDWKRHPHFNRGWLYKEPFLSALATMASRLKEERRRVKANAASGGFEAVHALVQEFANDVKGLGPLAIYDIATLLGHRFGFRPTTVYLHAGTLQGARQLFGTPNISRDNRLTPKQMRRVSPLEADEIEDFLCIYKKQLRELRSRRRLPEWSFT